MPKFSVEVKVRAEASYTVEVEAKNARAAEAAAVSQWRDLTPPDFQVDKIDGAEAEAEQVSWECEADGCAKQISFVEWSEGGGYCRSCATEAEAA